MHKAPLNPQQSRLAPAESMTGNAAGPQRPIAISDIAAAACNILAGMSGRAECNVRCGAGCNFDAAGAGALRRDSVEQMDVAWDHLRQLGVMLAQRASQTPVEIRSKIRIWRAIVDEQIFDKENQTADEALLCSIIDDVERLFSE